MRGRKADTFQTVDFVEVPDQSCQPLGVAVICVDVLTQQRDFLYTTFDQFLCLAHDAVGWARHLCTARVRHDAERTEFVAAFLNGQKCSRTTFCLGASLERVELVIIGKISIERFFARLHRLFHGR